MEAGCTVLGFRGEEGERVAVKVENSDPVNEAYGGLMEGRCTQGLMKGVGGEGADGISPCLWRSLDKWKRVSIIAVVSSPFMEWRWGE